MSRSPARRALVLLATPLLLALTLPTAGAESPEPGPAPSVSPSLTPEDPLRVVVTDLLPRNPQPGGAFEVHGILRNEGATPVTGIQVRLRIGNPVITRGGLHDGDSDRPLTQSRGATTVSPLATTLQPGSATKFAIRTTVRELGLSRLGVYPLDIEARGDAGDGPGPLGLAPTWVPYFDGLRVQPTRVAVLWPVADRPHQRALGTFRDDELDTALSDHGRLGRLVSAAGDAAVPECERALATPPGTTPPTPRCEPTRVTYAVDPDLLLAARAMTGTHSVEVNGKTAKRPAVGAASSWLAALGRATADSALIALPYGDPDVTAMSRGGDARLRDDLSLAGVLGRSAVAETLHVSPLQTVAWPPAGVVTPAAADALSRGGARALVLDPSAYDQLDSEPNRAPSARTLLPSSSGSNLEGLVADPYLSDLVTGELAADVGSRLAEQRFLAETAIVAAEAPSLSRTLVIAPERRGDLDVKAATGALRDLGRVPWLCPVSIEAVAQDQEQCSTGAGQPVPRPDDRGALRTSRTSELSPSYLGAVSTERQRAVQLTDAVLTDTADPAVTAMKAQLRRAVARAESSAWRTDGDGAGVSLRVLREDLDDLVGKVVVRGGQVLLTSASGTIQVSITNSLEVPVTVRVRFEARTLGLVAAQSPLVEVAPDTLVPVNIRTTAQRSGRFFVDAHLVDRNGDDFGQPTVVNLRSTRYGRTALALTIGSAGVLLIAAAVRVVRRTLRHNARA
ncbi:MAG: glycoprotein [Frankiales bacterium]|nr:glycoprotein [Frankiales bacterium]